MTLPVRSLALLSLITLGTENVVGQTLIYDVPFTLSRGLGFVMEDGETSGSTELAGGEEADDQYGDVITFAGSARRITRFDVGVGIWAFGSGPEADVTTTARLTLWSVNGITPVAPLWTGAVENVRLRATGFAFETLLTFTPDVVVPDTIAYSIGFDTAVWASSRNAAAGAYFRTIAPSVGSSPARLIVRNTASGAWSEDGFRPDSNGLARVWAVPAPSAVALLGAAGLIAARRRR